MAINFEKPSKNVFLNPQITIKRKAKQYEKDVAEAYEKRAAEIAALHHAHQHHGHGLHLGLGLNKNEFNPHHGQHAIAHHHKEKYREIDTETIGHRHPPSVEAAHVMDFQYLTIMVLYENGEE